MYTEYMNTERTVPLCPPVALLLFSVELLPVAESASTSPLPRLLSAEVEPALPTERNPILLNRIGRRVRPPLTRSHHFLQSCHQFPSVRSLCWVVMETPSHH